ncbi:MAG: hypothetical protein JRN17_01630 [Nitrososphaerota archaeon]|nr:hypothetical protein [Nitrososphaerota archaeon]
MKTLPILMVSLVLATSFAAGISRSSSHGPCDSYGDCVSSSIVFLRSNPDHTLYVGDSFGVPLSVTTGPNASGYSVSWSYAPVLERSGDTFTVMENETGTFTISASVTFTGPSFSSVLTTSESVTVVQLVVSLQTHLINVTDSQGSLLRNEDGTFYRNDSFCESWTATFQFAAQRTDIKINITSAAPSLRVLNYSADPLGRTGRFCYVVETNAAYRSQNVTLVARALNWQGVSLGLKSSSQPFAVVRYDPQFTAYAYMEYRNSTASSSLERPWVLFVRYDGNDPDYSYAGDSNTRPFNGSITLQERAYFDNFTFTSLSYQPSNVTGAFTYHVVNSTGLLRYRWLNGNSSAMLEGDRRIQKYVFEVEPSSLAPLLGQGFVYQNVTMSGRWTHEAGYALKEDYWMVPFLWNGKVNVVSVGSNGEVLSNTPISITMHNPSPLDDWLTSNFEHVFGDDPQALRAFQEDLYPTNRTMTFTGEGTLSLLLNQTSLVPPEISITAGGVTQSGNFTFVPVFVNSTVMSVPDAFNGTVFHVNATIPLWSYNMLQGNMAFLPVSTTISQPTTFLELVNDGSSGWMAGNATAPQTPSAFASQEYGFWPMGENLTVYVNLQGGGVDLLGVQRVTPSEYQAMFYVEPWSGGISSVQLIEGAVALPRQSTMNASAYPSPLPAALTGLYSITYPASGQETRVVFTNAWGATTVLDLGTATSGNSSVDLIPTTTVAVFGIAFLAWLMISSVLKTKKPGVHE